MRWLRSPLVHFLLLGVALFAGRTLLADREQAESRFLISIGAARVDELAQEFRRSTGRSPDRRELAGLVEAEVEEEILFREAVARGLLERDGGVQTRLVQKMLFLEGGGELEDAPALLARAVELGLHEDDIVVRRILVQKMRLIGSRLREDQQVSPRELEDAYQARREALRAPDRADLVHVFLSRDAHGGALAGVADSLLERLRSEAVPVADAPALGEPFPLGHVLERRSQEELERRFGPGFGKAVFALPDAGWNGPIESAYGAHLVFVTARETGAPPPLARVADRLRLELEEDRRLANLEALLETLRGRYQVRVEPADAADARHSSQPPAQEPG